MAVTIIASTSHLRMKNLVNRTTSSSHCRQLGKSRSAHTQGPVQRTARKPETEVLPGILPPNFNAIPYPIELPHGNISKNLSETWSTVNTYLDSWQILADLMVYIHLASSTVHLQHKHCLWSSVTRRSIVPPIVTFFFELCSLIGGWKDPSDLGHSRNGDLVMEDEGGDQRVHEIGLTDMNGFTYRMEPLALAGIDSGWN